MFEVEVLIDLVKARPPLYNHTLIEYKSKPFCAVLWNEIAETMNKEATQCRVVWTSLRSSYARHLQNMENNAKGINRRKKAEWYLADKMAFLNDFMLRTPQDRNLKINRQDANNSMGSADDNSIPFTSFEYNNENNNDCNMDDSHSIVTIKSEEISELTLSSQHEEISNKVDDVLRVRRTNVETEDLVTSYPIKKCRVELTSRDQNILTPSKQNSMKKEVPKEVPVIKQSKISSEERSSMVKEEAVDAEAREESTLMFFQSILFDLRKLSDRKLRLFKQELLQDLNKCIDEDEG